MAYRLIIADEVHLDIDMITNYITYKLANPNAAIGFLDDVERSYNKVVENPFIYSLCRNVRLRKLDYRFIVMKNYLMFFRVEESLHTVYIVRVVYSARDYAELL